MYCSMSGGKYRLHRQIKT